MRHFRKFLNSLLKSEYINYIVFKARFFYYVYVVRNIKVFQNDNSVMANQYSIDMLKKGKTSNRPMKLIGPLQAIECVRKDGYTLSVGCRFETELLFLQAFGFNPEKMRGLDMISYTPWVDLGNMHAMPYADSSMDTMVLGWILPYSDNPPQAAKEIIRVTKNGGVVAIGLSAYSDETRKKMIENKEYRVPPETRKQTTEEVLALFGENIKTVYYRHDPERGSDGSCAVIFSIKK
ncbi:MAG: class I SAM-dependent methyltransferase [Pseudobdellovibrio sp.]